MNPFQTGILFCFLSVLLGAFGAHGLKTHVSAEYLAIWSTGMQYQFYHGLALIGLGLWAHQSQKSVKAILICFTLGIILFSGSLYLLVLTDIKQFGTITPLGGVLFLAGWIWWFGRSLDSNYLK